MPHESERVTLPLGSLDAISEIIKVPPGHTAVTIQGIPDADGWGAAVVAIEWSLDGRTFVELDEDFRMDSSDPGWPGLEIGNATHLRFKVITADGAADANCPIYVQTGTGFLLNVTRTARAVTKFKPGDQSKTSDTTPADDNDLKDFAVVAGADYTVEGVIFMTAVSVTPDFNFRFGGPSGATFACWTDWGRVGASNVVNDYITALSQGNAIALGTANDEAMLVSGLLRIGTTAGNFAFQWNQNTSSADATTVRAGSWLRLTRI